MDPMARRQDGLAMPGFTDKLTSSPSWWGSDDCWSFGAEKAFGVGRLGSRIEGAGEEGVPLMA